MPKGLLSMVHGGKEAVDGLLEHPDVKAISFVGSTNVARYIYAKGTANGKRVQAQGGAKNPVVIMPDADLDTTTKIITKLRPLPTPPKNLGRNQEGCTRDLGWI